MQTYLPILKIKSKYKMVVSYISWASWFTNRRISRCYIKRKKQTLVLKHKQTLNGEDGKWRYHISQLTNKMLAFITYSNFGSSAFDKKWQSKNILYSLCKWCSVQNQALKSYTSHLSQYVEHSWHVLINIIFSISISLRKLYKHTNRT